MLAIIKAGVETVVVDVAVEGDWNVANKITDEDNNALYGKIKEKNTTLCLSCSHCGHCSPTIAGSGATVFNSSFVEHIPVVTV